MTRAYYKDLKPCPFAPEDCFVFTRQSAVKKTWSVRIKRQLVRSSYSETSSSTTTKSRYFTKSLRTTDETEALRLAHDVYIDFRGQEKRGFVPGNATFSKLFDHWFKKINVSPNRRTSIAARSEDLLYFYGNFSITSITGKSFDQYIKWRCSEARYQWKLQSAVSKVGTQHSYRAEHLARAPSDKSLQAERQVLGQFLRWAKKEEYISSVPHLERRFATILGDPSNELLKFNGGRVAAKSLDKRTFNRIQGYLQHFAHPKLPNEYHPDPRVRFARLRLFYFLWTCYGSLARTAEARFIKWNDLTEYTDEHGTFYVVLIRHPKTTANAYRRGAKVRRTVLSRQQSSLMPEWKKICIEMQQYEPDGYVFPSWLTANQRAQGTPASPVEVHLMSRMFGRLLKAKGLTHTKAGLKIGLNSFCRHSAIRDAIVNTPHTIADTALRAGNTLQTISTHYLEMFVEDQAAKLASVNPKDRTTDWGVREPKIERALRAAHATPPAADDGDVVNQEVVKTEEQPRFDVDESARHPFLVW